MQSAAVSVDFVLAQRTDRRSRSRKHKRSGLHLAHNYQLCDILLVIET